MVLKKSQLYSSLWAGADELRGSMDASQYKDYVLTLLFVKYVSDKAKSDRNSLIDVPKGGSFDDLIALKGKSDIGDQINVAIRILAEANDLQGVINIADFNDANKLGEGKAMQDRLSKLIGIFQDLDFSRSKAEGDDLLGDAYEYLMRHFAVESGKSKGQFYTPAEVSRVMAALLEIPADTPKATTVYGPTCGSGSLLIKVADAAPNGLSIYGQGNDNATWALARMNMFLHAQPTAEIRQGDTIASPRFVDGDKLQAFDYLVANPPFSTKPWSNGLQNEYGRFDGYGRPPQKNGDYAFLLHMIKSLKSTGKGAVILPHGVLFRGNVEATIRKQIVRRGYIKGIISLPPNLFYGTGIPACIIVLDKAGADKRQGIFMIDASKGFEKDGNKNRLRPRDMHQIIDVFTKQIEVERYSRLVPLTEISDPKNDYNLNIPRYVDSSEPEDIQDLHAHLKGGIPNRDLDELHAYWEAFPTLRAVLLRPLREGYSELRVEKSAIQPTILESDEYKGFAATINGLVSEWWKSHQAEMEGIHPTTKPNELITSIGESLLETLKPQPLIDEYGAYEQLLRYWNDTMHDDVAMVVGDSWIEAAKPRKAIEDKERKLTETPDLVIGSGKTAQKYKMDLIPPALVKAHYFPDDLAKLEELIADSAVATQELESFVEENGGEEGLLSEAMEDDKAKKPLAAARLKVAKNEADSQEEVGALTKFIELVDAETAAKRAVKDATIALDQKTLSCYGKLAEADIKRLVIDHKWGASIEKSTNYEIDHLIQNLSCRIDLLANRYGEPLSNIADAVSVLSKKVDEHLRRMGAL